MNSFLKDKYESKFKKRDELEGVIFSGTLKISNRIHLIQYISGHNKRYFANDLNHSIINFQLSEEMSRYKGFIGEKIAIVNDLSSGYEEGMTSPLTVGLLNKVSTRSPIPVSRKETIFNYIPN